MTARCGNRALQFEFYFAKEIRCRAASPYAAEKLHKNEKQVWQTDNYPEVIESAKFLEQKTNYIYNNPVEKGYVEKPEEWVYASARNRILDDDGIIKLDEVDLHFWFGV